MLQIIKVFSLNKCLKKDPKRTVVPLSKGNKRASWQGDKCSALQAAEETQIGVWNE